MTRILRRLSESRSQSIGAEAGGKGTKRRLPVMFGSSERMCVSVCLYALYMYVSNHTYNFMHTQYTVLVNSCVCTLYSTCMCILQNLNLLIDVLMNDELMTSSDECRGGPKHARNVRVPRGCARRPRSTGSHSRSLGARLPQRHRMQNKGCTLPVALTGTQRCQ